VPVKFADFDENFKQTSTEKWSVCRVVMRREKLTALIDSIVLV